MNDVLEKTTPYGECPICGDLLEEEEMPMGICENCREEYEEEKEL